MNDGPQNALEKTLGDLQIRSEVEATMQSMLVDVELAASLHKDLAIQAELADMEKKTLQHESALNEAQAVQSQQRQQQVSLADTLVQELWTLSQELGELRRWKETHETTVIEHDELIARLLQAEEQIRLLESRPPTSQVPAAPDTYDFLSPPITEPQASADTPVVLDQNIAAEDKEAHEDIEAQQDEPVVETEPDETVVDVSPPAEENDSQRDTDLVEQPEPAPVEQDGEAVVALLQEEAGGGDDDDVPSLDTLDMRILTEIFEFLDALEILYTAQVNVTLYSRVDALFGLGAGATEADVVPPPPQEVASLPPPAPSSVASTESTAPISNVSRMQPEVTETDAKMPAQPSSSTGPGERRGLFSLLQNRGGPAGRRSAAATTDQPLSAAMTDSMVAKLTDKELSAIFSLTEKLHQRENVVAALTAEKEELAGKLEGTEALKEFLINKVRDVEQSLRKSQEDEVKVTQQISSDQEVIAFLDGRVQELEKNTAALTDEKKKIVEEMTKMQSQNDKKIEVLGDMLQFERERVSTNEREWKATKKLLVKEIKSCRAQLMALQAERDGFREQNERLKKAVLSMNPSNGPV